jgi:hypothetical protein
MPKQMWRLLKMHMLANYFYLYRIVIMSKSWILPVERTSQGSFIAHTPNSINDLGDVSVRIPEFLGNSGIKAEFVDTLTEAVRNACGSSACKACVMLDSNSSAVAICPNELCPTEE